MRPASELNSDELNREIARLRGDVRDWILNADGEIEQLLGHIWPNYLEWANAGPLLEKMVADMGWPAATEYIWEHGIGDMAVGTPCIRGIRRAYYEWRINADTE